MSTEKKIDLDTLCPEPVITSLCNFSPFIVSQVRHDDGAETTTKVKVSGISSSGKIFPTVEVISEEYPSLNWVTKQWGLQ